MAPRYVSFLASLDLHTTFILLPHKEEYTHLISLVQNSQFFSSLLLSLRVAYFHFSQGGRENEIEESCELRFYQ